MNFKNVIYLIFTARNEFDGIQGIKIPPTIETTLGFIKIKLAKKQPAITVNSSPKNILVFLFIKNNQTNKYYKNN